jgi:small subunit ribosomal protein S11
MFAARWVAAVNQRRTIPTPDEVATTPAQPVVEEKPTAVADATGVVAKRKGKKKKFVTAGRAHIQATYNNTIVTLTDQGGNVLAWSSAGKCGFKGPKKATPYAAGVIVRDVVERTKIMGLKQVDVFVRGVGMGREAAVRALAGAGLQILAIKDITPVPHNGPRAPKPRRV